MRSLAELQRITDEALNAQMDHIRAAQQEFTAGHRYDVSANLATTSIEELRKRLNAIESEQERRRRFVRKKIAAIRKICGSLLEKHG